MACPFRETALSEFPFFVSDQHDSFDQGACRDDVAIVDLEPHHLQVILNVARENELNALELFGEQIQFIEPIHVPRDFLSIVSDIADGLLPIEHAGHRIASPVRGFNNGSPLVKGDIFQTKRNVVPFKDMPHGDAERRPGKLDEREHGAYMTEEGRKFNSRQNLKMNRQSRSAIVVYQDGRVKIEEARED